MSLLDYLNREDDRNLLERRMKAEGRLPPGQSATVKWPVLHRGEVPRFDEKTWDFRVEGLVEHPTRLDSRGFRALGKTVVVTDFHCVTRWSSFDNRWEGVPARTVLRRVSPRPQASHVMVLGHVGDKPHGYETNLALVDLDRDDVLFAWRRNGEDISPEHGWPLRLVVPHLYAWKSCKWVRGLLFLDQDRPGFWERGGYHDRGDPFREERYSRRRY